MGSIIVDIRGGLGNQLFQYAFGYALSKQYNIPMYLDLAWFQRTNRVHPREYDLDSFNISAQEKVSGHSAIIKERSNRKIEIKPTQNTLVRGFWVNERHFSSVASDIQNEFTIKTPSKQTQSLANEMHKTNSISMHVRGADKSIKRFQVCTKEYYRAAVEHFTSTEKDPVFYLFTDDPSYATDVVDADNVVVVSHNHKNGTDAEDIYLMSQCKHNVIANSTFSWWGAWLNQSSEKTIIYPKQWNPDNTINMDEYIPASWRRDQIAL